jgi:heme/copper-type cytochrome/quinol oxidase subunit 2
MSGWLPGDVTIPANQAITIQITNSESPFHDGGGLHNLVIPELNMQVDIPPKSTKVIALPPMAAGSYTFYCDVCCGGKENPSMRGVIKVG